jgi:hypothetical protein
MGRQLGNWSGHMHHRQRETVVSGVGDVAREHFVEQYAEACIDQRGRPRPDPEFVQDSCSAECRVTGRCAS